MVPASLSSLAWRMIATSALERWRGTPSRVERSQIWTRMYSRRRPWVGAMSVAKDRTIMLDTVDVDVDVDVEVWSDDDGGLEEEKV